MRCAPVRWVERAATSGCTLIHPAELYEEQLHKVGGALLRRPRRTPLRRDG